MLLAAAGAPDHRMTNTMTTIRLALLTLATLTGAASALQRTFYDASEHVARRAARPTWSVRLSLPMMVVRTVRMPKLISSAIRSLRAAVPRWHEIARAAPESTSNWPRSAGARSLVPRLWAHKALDAAGDHIHVCLP